MANTNQRRFFVGGNWKMNFSQAILERVNEALNKTHGAEGEKSVGKEFRLSLLFVRSKN